jgi:hypothetical protein
MATPKKPRVLAEVQPEPGASMIAYVSDASAAMMSSCPTGSAPRARGARDSGTNSALSTRAARPTGTLTQKIPRQPTDAIRTPPSTGPRAMLMPNTLPQTPIARARSAGSVKVLVTMDSATGLSIDPPTACSTRNATSHPSAGATLHSREPRVNSTRPVWNILRRPTRSPVEPDRIRKLARTSV